MNLLTYATARNKPSNPGLCAALRAVITALVMLPVGFWLTTCGLDLLVYLEPPRNDTIESQGPPIPIVVFRHNEPVNNVPEFRGYELYYKFYNDETRETGQEAFENDRGVILGTPATGTGRLENRGYRRVRGRFPSDQEGTDLQRPLIDIHPADRENKALDVTIRFFFDPESAAPDQAIAYWQFSVGERIKVLERSIGNGRGRAFYPIDLEQYTSEEADIPVTLNIQTVLHESNLAIGLFVLAYGIDTQNFNDIYSEPAALMYARIDVN